MLLALSFCPGYGGNHGRVLDLPPGPQPQPVPEAGRRAGPLRQLGLPGLVRPAGGEVRLGLLQGAAREVLQ